MCSRKRREKGRIRNDELWSGGGAVVREGFADGSYATTDLLYHHVDRVIILHPKCVRGVRFVNPVPVVQEPDTPDVLPNLSSVRAL